MDKETLQLILDNDIASNELGSDTGHLVLPNTMTAHDMEKFAPQRRRFRGTMSTSSKTAFTQYVVAHKQEPAMGLACFVDADAMTATAIFNMGDEIDPGHCDDRACLDLERTAAFLAFTSNTGSRTNHSARELAEFIEDWRDCIHVLNEVGEEIALPAGVNAIRTATITSGTESIHEAKSLSESRSLMESVEASSKEGVMPAGLSFTCLPHKDLPERVFYCRLSVITSHEKPKFMLKPILIEKHFEEMAEEFKQLIVESGIDMPIYIGSFSAK